MAGAFGSSVLLAGKPERSRDERPRRRPRRASVRGRAGSDADGVRAPDRDGGEAAALLGISRNLAYELVARKELPSVRLGRRVLVPRRALDRLLDVGGAPELP